MTKRKQILEFYDRASVSYAEHLRGKPYEAYRNDCINRALLSFFPSRQKPTVLDVGCGTGEFTFPLLMKNYPSLTLHGSDLSLAMLNQAKKRFPKAHLKTADAEHLPYRNNSFDLVISREMLEHVPRPLQVLKEAYRVLKPGGHFVASTPSWFGLIAPVYFIKRYLLKSMQEIDDWWTPFSLCKTLKQAGFQIEKMTSICPMLYHDKLPHFFLPIVKLFDRVFTYLPFLSFFGRVLVVRCHKPKI